MIQKKRKVQREIGSFMRQYKRKAQSGQEPNDRKYDRNMERQIKNMDPTELSEIISGDGSAITQEIDELWFNLKPIAGVKFTLNDSVEIVKGKYMGQKVTVVLLIEVTPEPRYIVELSTGEGVNILESQIKSL